MLNKATLAIFLMFFVSIAYAQPELFEALKASEKWLMPANACPTDVINDKHLDIGYTDVCKNNETNCLNYCQQGKASSCYNLAIELQTAKNKKLDLYSEALFLRSCKLGSLSGCTNRAAGIDMGVGAKNTHLCSVKTYQKVCELGDPWACTMYGYHLSTGKVIKQDTNKAIEVMADSCKYGLDDPACSISKEIMKSIQSKK